MRSYQIHIFVSKRSSHNHCHTKQLLLSVTVSVRQFRSLEHSSKSPRHHTSQQLYGRDIQAALLSQPAEQTPLNKSRSELYMYLACTCCRLSLSITYELRRRI